MKEKNVNLPEIRAILKTLVDQANEDSKKIYEEEFKDFFSTVGENVDWTNPDSIYYLFVFKIKEAIMQKCLEETNYSHEAAFVILNYSSFDCLIKEMADLGQGCSADMSRWVLREYINTLSNADYTPTEINHDKYYMPSFGSTTDWLDFAEGILKLIRYGKSEKFEDAQLKLRVLKKEILEKMVRKRDAIKKFSPRFKDHLERLCKNNKITEEEYSFCFTVLGGSVIWEFVDSFLTDEYTLTDEDIIASIKKHFASYFPPKSQDNEASEATHG